MIAESMLRAFDRLFSDTDRLHQLEHYLYSDDGQLQPLSFHVLVLNLIRACHNHDTPMPDIETMFANYSLNDWATLANDCHMRIYRTKQRHIAEWFWFITGLAHREILLRVMTLEDKTRQQSLHVREIVRQNEELTKNNKHLRNIIARLTQQLRESGTTIST